MKIIEPKVELINSPSYSGLLSLIELAGRTCYKSESKITEDSAEKFVRNILKRGHEAVIEHGMDMEINRQIIEADKRYTDDIDAMVLYTLAVHLGFGPKRLRRFYEAFAAEHDRLIQHYEMPDDYTWLCKEQLKKIGVDVEAWNRERGSIHDIREQ